MKRYHEWIVKKKMRTLSETQRKMDQSSENDSESNNVKQSMTS